MVAERDAEGAPRSERGSELHCRLLLALQKRHHPLLIASEGCDVIVPAAVQFACKHISLGHSKPSSFAGNEGDAGCGIADQCRAAFCPAVHADLADTVEIDAS